jgi:hypothetical protein
MNTPPKPPAQRKREAGQSHLKALLLEGLHGGEATEMTRQDWQDIRREALKRVGEAKARPKR